MGLIMKYISTRGNQQELQSAEAIIAGIADDGGLFVPITLPSLEAGFIEKLIDLNYQERAQKVLAKFLVDYTAEELEKCVNNAYGDDFDSAAVAPTINFDKETSVLELWHGPTSAFKDMALQYCHNLCLQLFRRLAKKRKLLF
jgi:threonine synthase